MNKYNLKRASNGGKTYKVIVIFFVILYLVKYLVLVLQNFQGSNFPLWFNIGVFLGLTVSYFVKFRNGNLLCFELLFLPVYFIGMFYDDLIYKNLPFQDVGAGAFRLAQVTDPAYLTKSAMLQMIAFLLFMLGCSIANSKKMKAAAQWDNYTVSGRNIDLKAVNLVLTALLLLILFYDYVSGAFDSWFAYTENIAGGDSYQGLGHITIMSMLLTVFEFMRLSKEGVRDFKSFLRKSNKLYIIVVLAVSLFIIYTGKRSSALLILIPMVVAYNVFIQKLGNKTVLFGVVAGALLMIVSGLARSSGDVAGVVIDLAGATEDFSMTSADCTYLIKYTDEHGPVYCASTPSAVIGGIPLVGTPLINLFDLSFKAQSPRVATEGLVAAGWKTGIGTSIVGDLYYNGKFFFVVAFMLFLGWFVSYLHNRLHVSKKFNAYLVLIYCDFVSNFTLIVYAMICIYLLGLFCQQNHQTK